MAAAGLPDFTSPSRVSAPRADVRSSAEPGYPLSRVERLIGRLAEAPAETGFIRSVDEAVDRFHTQVVAQVEAPAPRPATASSGMDMTKRQD